MDYLVVIFVFLFIIGAACATVAPRRRWWKENFPDGRKDYYR